MVCVRQNSVLSAEVSTDMSQIWILSAIDSEEGPSKCRVVLDVAATGLDMSMRRKLKMIADKVESLNGLLRYIDAVLKLMNEEQSKLYELSASNWKRLGEALYDQGCLCQCFSGFDRNDLTRFCQRPSPLRRS